jgi:predicted phage-related endonuclease
MKSAEWHERRRGGIGGSDANILMAGDPERIYRLWLEKQGKVEPEDLSWVLPVQIGTLTEELNASFYAHTTGRAVTDRNTPMVRAATPYMRCELDGLTTTAAGEPAVWEAKHVNAFSSIDEVTQRYMPQFHHNMHIAGLRHCVLSAFIGTQKHEIVEVTLDDAYMMTLLNVEQRFWACVESKTPPEGFTPYTVAVPHDQLRTVSMAGNNAWASAAIDWLNHQPAAKLFDKAAKDLKAMVLPDVGTATGHGVKIKRSKSGSLTISMEK